MPKETIKTVVRPLNADDINFILNSWLLSYKHSSYFAKRIRDTVFYKYHHQVCSRTLNRPNTKALIACDPEDPSVIYGYLIYEKFDDSHVFHYAYVKSPFRKLGVGAELLKASELDPNNCVFSHWTTDTDWLVKKYLQLTYVPYLI